MARKTKNQAAERALKAAERVENFAQLISSDGNTFEFQYNPETIRRTRSANYAKANVGATSQQRQEWINSDGGSLELPGLLLDGYNLGKTVEPAIAALEKLLEASTQNAGETPTVNFVWGTRSYGPAKLSSLSIDESLWLDGETAQARVSLTLIAHAPVIAPVATPAAATAANLTPRQRQDARTQATAWLSANNANYPQAVRDAFRASAFAWRTSTNGDVDFVVGGQTVARIGNWDGFTFTPEINAQ